MCVIINDINYHRVELIGFIGGKGVQKVDINVSSGKVIVKGSNFDVKQVQERVERKTRKKVELISPKPKPKEVKPPEKKKEEKKEVSSL